MYTRVFEVEGISHHFTKHQKPASCLMNRANDTHTHRLIQYTQRPVPPAWQLLCSHVVIVSDVE